MIYTEFVIRIFLSMLLGFLIGLERQLTGHPAGIRINVLICIGTSFFTLFPMLYGSDQVFRVGSSIISGVGFLCSGVIFKDSGTVRGMNTAATLWCTAAIGILASTGMYAIAVTAAGILIASNLILRPLARKLNPIAAGDESEKQYRISVTCQEDAEQEIRLLLINCNPCKTLYLNNLESGGVVGDKVEIVAEYCSLGKPKNQVLEGSCSLCHIYAYAAWCSAGVCCPARRLFCLSDPLHSAVYGAGDQPEKSLCASLRRAAVKGGAHDELEGYLDDAVWHSGFVRTRHGLLGVHGSSRADRGRDECRLLGHEAP